MNVKHYSRFIKFSPRFVVISAIILQHLLLFLIKGCGFRNFFPLGFNLADKNPDKELNSKILQHSLVAVNILSVWVTESGLDIQLCGNLIKIREGQIMFIWGHKLFYNVNVRWLVVIIWSPGLGPTVDWCANVVPCPPSCCLHSLTLPSHHPCKHCGGRAVWQLTLQLSRCSISLLEEWCIHSHGPTWLLSTLRHTPRNTKHLLLHWSRPRGQGMTVRL